MGSRASSPTVSWKPLPSCTPFSRNWFERDHGLQSLIRFDPRSTSLHSACTTFFPLVTWPFFCSLQRTSRSVFPGYSHDGHLLVHLHLGSSVSSSERSLSTQSEVAARPAKHLRPPSLYLSWHFPLSETALLYVCATCPGTELHRDQELCLIHLYSSAQHSPWHCTLWPSKYLAYELVNEWAHPTPAPTYTYPSMPQA